MDTSNIFTKCSSVDSKPIIVRVGKTKQEYHVHEKLLRASSEFFNNALKKEWKEGQEAAVDLLDTEPKHFEAWTKFLYTGRVFFQEQEADGMPKDLERVAAEILTWVDLYSLGDFIRDTDFRDALIDALIDWMCVMDKIPLSLSSFVYSHTTNASTHRRFAVDVHVHVWGRKQNPIKVEHPAEFLQDVLDAIMPDLHKGIASRNLREWFERTGSCQ